MRKTREERKIERSEKASRAATLGWERYHEAKAAAGVVDIYDQPHAYGDFKITIESIRSGKTNVLYLREGERRDNFYVELNGQPFKPEQVSISTIARIIRKSIVKTKSGRIF
jgi:hypothetical protein